MGINSTGEGEKQAVTDLLRVINQTADGLNSTIENFSHWFLIKLKFGVEL